jgi:predicted ATP-binding protein involved in virulence
MTVRIKRIVVEKLFGLFDYTIDLNMDERLTILIAPNGYGKTKILEMLYAFLNGNFGYFIGVSFFRFQVVFIDEESKDRTFIIEKKQDKKRGYLEIILRENEEIYTIIDASSSSRQLNLFDDRDYPMIKRISENTYVNIESGEYLTDEEVMRLEMRNGRINSQILPEVEKIMEFVKKISSNYIATQRLVAGARRVFSDEDFIRSRRSRIDRQTPSISENARSLSLKIQESIQEFAQKSQKLDSQLPNKIVRKVSLELSKKPRKTNAKKVSDDQSIEENFRILNERKQGISDLGLLDYEQINLETISFPEISNQNSDIVEVIMGLIIENAFEKIAVFNDISKKLRYFLDIINERLKFKKLKIDRKNGYQVFGSDGEVIPLTQLSSGEQHQIILIYELLFNTPPGSLIIIDEPEISLHISWQNMFLADLLKIAKETISFDVIVATHSPDLVGENYHLIVDLAQMGGDGDEQSK